MRGVGRNYPQGPSLQRDVLTEVLILEVAGRTLREGSFLCKSLSEGCPAPTGHPHSAAPSTGDDIILSHDAPGQWEELERAGRPPVYKVRCGGESQMHRGAWSRASAGLGEPADPHFYEREDAVQQNPGSGGAPTASRVPGAGFSRSLGLCVPTTASFSRSLGLCVPTCKMGSHGDHFCSVGRTRAGMLCGAL